MEQNKIQGWGQVYIGTWYLGMVVTQINGERRDHLINGVGKTGLLCRENKTRPFLNAYTE